MITEKINEEEIGLRIKKEFDINIVKHLKLVRCCSSLIRAIGFLVLVKNDIKNENFLQCGSNLYYSAFQLSIALLFLSKEKQINLSDYILSARATSNITQKRIFNIPHVELPSTIKNLKEYGKFSERLSTRLKNLIELRELNSYGPYLQLVNDNDVSDKNVGFSYRFVQLKSHLDILNSQKPFTEIFKICENEKDEIEKLIDDFFEIFVVKSKTFGKLQSQILMYALSALIPEILSPNCNKDILCKVESKIKQLAKKLGKQEEILYDKTKKKMFNQLRKKNEKGDIQKEVRVGLSRKRTLSLE